MSASGKALVLGGGGVTGIAWELGLLAGLQENGLDLTSPDLIVGTSAGSVVGAQVLSGISIEELYAEQLKDPVGEAAARMGIGILVRFVMASMWPGDACRGRAYVGHAALAARTVPESNRRGVIEGRLRGHSWPAVRLLVTAVDAETGEFKVFDRDSGVTLTDAVAASCAVPIVWPPITVSGRRYIDGGVRSIAKRIWLLVATASWSSRPSRLRCGKAAESPGSSPSSERACVRWCSAQTLKLEERSVVMCWIPPSAQHLLALGVASQPAL